MRKTKISMPEDLLRLPEINNPKEAFDLIHRYSDHPEKEYVIRFRQNNWLVDDDTQYFTLFEDGIRKFRDSHDRPISQMHVYQYQYCYSHRFIFYYMNEDGEVYMSECKNLSPVTVWSRFESKSVYTGKVEFEPFTEWKVAKIMPYVECINPERVSEYLSTHNPYALEFAKEHNIKPMLLVLAPQLEQLYKAGFEFAKSMIRKAANSSVHCYCGADESDLAYFQRLTKPGTNLKTIFKTPRFVYEALKEEVDLSKWDAYRRMVKTGKISFDFFKGIDHFRYTPRQLTQISSILGKEYQGKRLFTFETLINYLERVDMYQAIPTDQALEILADYLSLCNFIGMKPVTDSNSLKREHDVASRMSIQVRNEKLAAEMKDKCEHFRDYHYEEDVFFADAISTYDALIDEATQQHNCVASYAQSIANGSTVIFSVRYTKEPQKTLATVQMTPDFSNVRQKYLACNQPIRNKSLTDFIERLRKRCRSTWTKRNATALAAN